MSQNSWHAWTTGPLDQAKMSMKPSFGFQLHEGHKMTPSEAHPRTGKKKCGNYSHLVLGVDVNQLFVAYFFERRIIKKKLAFMHHVQVAVSQSMELPANTEGPWIKLPSFFHPPWQNWSDELCAASKNFLACHHMKNDYSHSKPGSILQFGQNMLFVPKNDDTKCACTSTYQYHQHQPTAKRFERSSERQGSFHWHSYFEHSWIFNLLLLQCWMGLLCEKT